MTMHIKIRLMLLILLMMFSQPVIGWTADVTLAWDPNTESDTVGYRLYAREHDEAYDYSHAEWQGSSTQCTATGFDEYESYYFVVRAVDEDGNESGDSNEVYWSPNGEASDNPSSGTHDSLGGDSDGVVAEATGCFIETIFEN
jgi:hypothetical protein